MQIVDAVWIWLRGAPLRIVLIVVLAVVVKTLANRAISRLVRRTVTTGLHERLGEARLGPRSLTLGGDERRRQRAETIGSVLRSITTFAVYTIAAVMILGELDVNLGPIIASAGIAGIALGFGAQSLVKDFVSGVSMILEAQYGVGDVVDVGEVKGTVEEVGLRVTRVRAFDGIVWYVRNGEILRVGNMSQGWSSAVIDVPVAYGEDLARAQRLIGEVAADLAAGDRFAADIIGEPTVAGVESMTGEAVVIRVIIKTASLKQYDVARAFREQVKAAFDREGVRLPVPIRAANWPAAGGTGDAGGTPAGGTGS